MPGRVIAVEVAAGDAVTKGQKLVTLEAMKMEHGLVAPFDGTVAELNADRRAGQRGQVLVDGGGCSVPAADRRRLRMDLTVRRRSADRKSAST